MCREVTIMDKINDYADWTEEELDEKHRETIAKMGEIEIIKAVKRSNSSIEAEKLVITEAKMRCHKSFMRVAREICSYKVDQWIEMSFNEAAYL